jgi:hypothetical protein
VGYRVSREGEVAVSECAYGGACDIGGAQSDDHARTWRGHQIEPRQYHILHSLRSFPFLSLSSPLLSSPLLSFHCISLTENILHFPFNSGSVWTGPDIANGGSCVSVGCRLGAVLEVAIVGGIFVQYVLPLGGIQEKLYCNVLKVG